MLFDRREYERLIAAPDITHMAAPQSWTVTHVRYRLPSPPSGDLADEETLARWVRSLVATQERFARHFTAPSPGFPYLPLVWDVHLAPVHLARLERYDTGDEDVPPPPRWARLDDFAVITGGHKMHSLPVSPADDGSAVLRDALCGWSPAPFTPVIDLLHTLGLGCQSPGRLGVRLLSDGVKALQRREAAASGAVPAAL